MLNFYILDMKQVSTILFLVTLLVKLAINNFNL